LDLLSPPEDSRHNGPALRKLYYSISEVAEVVGVPPHVLRYWETEFSHLRPKKAKGGNRLYQERDIQKLQEIKNLLYEQKFTIAGAKVQLASKHERAHVEAGLIRELTIELREILDLMNRRS
jgi:DNA-binding transcriptional MerR regulator